MLLEISLWKFLLGCVVSFLLGYLVVYLTITQPNHKDGFETFYIFKKLGLTKLFSKLWELISK